MGINFDFAKKFAVDQTLKQAMKYLEKDPEGNFPRLLKIAEKLVRRDNHKRGLQAVIERYESTP